MSAGAIGRIAFCNVKEFIFLLKDSFISIGFTGSPFSLQWQKLSYLALSNFAKRLNTGGVSGLHYKAFCALN